MERQKVRRLFKFETCGHTMVVPVICECLYDPEYGLVTFTPKVIIDELRHEPYKGEHVSIELAAQAKLKAFTLAQWYNWEKAYIEDTRPV